MPEELCKKGLAVINEINEDLNINGNIINLDNLLLELYNLLSKDASISKDKLVDKVIEEAEKILKKYSPAYYQISDEINSFEYAEVYKYVYKYMQKIINEYHALYANEKGKKRK